MAWFPGSVVSVQRGWGRCGVRIRLGVVAEAGVSPVAVVEDPDVVEDRVGELDAGFPASPVGAARSASRTKSFPSSRCRARRQRCRREGMRPAERILSLKAHEVNWIP